MSTDVPLDALEMGIWRRQRRGRSVQGLVDHSDAGSQYTSIGYTEPLAEAGVKPSIGSVGDSDDRPDPCGWPSRPDRPHTRPKLAT